MRWLTQKDKCDDVVVVYTRVRKRLVARMQKKYVEGEEIAKEMDLWRLRSKREEMQVGESI